MNFSIENFRRVLLAELSIDPKQYEIVHTSVQYTSPLLSSFVEKNGEKGLFEAFYQYYQVSLEWFQAFEKLVTMIDECNQELKFEFPDIHGALTSEKYAEVLEKVFKFNVRCIPSEYKAFTNQVVSTTQAYLASIRLINQASKEKQPIFSAWIPSNSLDDLNARKDIVKEKLLGLEGNPFEECELRFEDSDTPYGFLVLVYCDLLPLLEILVPLLCEELGKYSSKLFSFTYTGGEVVWEEIVKDKNGLILNGSSIRKIEGNVVFLSSSVN